MSTQTQTSSWYLGIDPGIEITGFAVVEGNGSRQKLHTYGVIRTDKSLSLSERLAILYTDMKEFLSQYPQVQIAGVEELFFSKNVTSAFAVGQARGVILLALEQASIHVSHLKPVEVKQAIVGSGAAKKEDVQRTVQMVFGLESIPKPDDAADAIAIAMAVSAIN